LQVGGLHATTTLQNGALDCPSRQKRLVKLRSIVYSKLNTFFTMSTSKAPTHKIQKDWKAWLKSAVPFGLGQSKPKHLRDMLGVAWKNRDNLSYATAFPGGKPVNAESAAALSAQYGFAVPAEPGLSATEMVEAAARGELDLLYAEVDPLNGATRDAVLMNPDDAAALHLIHDDWVVLINHLDLSLVTSAPTGY
jgi:hypothetical protein